MRFQKDPDTCGRGLTLLHFVEFSNVHNGDRITNAIRSSLAYKYV